MESVLHAQFIGSSSANYSYNSLKFDRTADQFSGISVLRVRVCDKSKKGRITSPTRIALFVCWSEECGRKWSAIRNVLNSLFLSRFETKSRQKLVLLIVERFCCQGEYERKRGENVDALSTLGNLQQFMNLPSTAECTYQHHRWRKRDCHRRTSSRWLRAMSDLPLCTTWDASSSFLLSRDGCQRTGS